MHTLLGKRLRVGMKRTCLIHVHVLFQNDRKPHRAVTMVELGNHTQILGRNIRGQ